MQQTVTLTNTELTEAVQLYLDHKNTGLVANRLSWNSSSTGANVVVECSAKLKPKTTVDYETWVNPYAGTSLDR